MRQLVDVKMQKQKVFGSRISSRLILKFLEDI